jgi:hypothetical protein
MMFGFNVALLAATLAAQTIYTLPQDLHWIPTTGKGVSPGAFYAMIRGKDTDSCNTLVRNKFPSGYVYPWHTNDNIPSIYTVLSGTLVIGFDKNHSRAKERTLPAGSVMQGLGSEPHYGRAIGETVFDVYTPCRR